MVMRISNTKVFMLFFICLAFGFAAGSFAEGISSRVNFPFFIAVSNEQPSPNDWIKQSQIKVNGERVVLDIQGAILTAYANTNSMDPVLDEHTTGLEVKPIEEKISVGDIISYKPSFIDGVIVHRVIEVGSDEKGTYYIVKGDNNTLTDPERVRFEQVEGVVVGLIY